MRLKACEMKSKKLLENSARKRVVAESRKRDNATCLEGFSRSFTVLSSLLYLLTSFLLYLLLFLLLPLLLPFPYPHSRVFSTTPWSSSGTREIFVRIKAPGINIPRSREGAGCEGTRVAGPGGGSDGDGRLSGGPKGVRACLPRSRNNGSITTPLPPDSITSSPLETHPLSLFLPSHALFLRPVVSLSFTLAFSHSFSVSFSVAPSEPRNGARVPFLLSRLRFPRPPSFLYTTSFAVVGEGETPAFAVGEAVLFFPLIKADRCGSGCRDDGTGRSDGGGKCTGRVARGAGRQRRWAEVVGRRWRRARHSMTCHVPTLPLTHPPRASRRHRRRPLHPVVLQPPPVPSPRIRMCIWKILARPPSNKPTRALLLSGSLFLWGIRARVSVKQTSVLANTCACANHINLQKCQTFFLITCTNMGAS